MASLLYRASRGIIELIRKFSHDRWNLIIVLLIATSLAFRIPVTPHELGSDSFATHTQVNTMLLTHDLSWELTLGNLKPDVESIKEFYPFSEPIILPLSLLMLSQFTGLDVEHSMLLLSIVLGVAGFFTSYAMAREFVNHRLTVFLASFFFSFSPIFLSMTNWTASSRGIFIAALPLVFWLLLKYENTRNPKFIAYSLGLALLLVPVHRMAILLPAIFIAFAVSRIYAAFYRILQRGVPFLANYLSTFVPIVLFTALLGIFGFSLIYDNPTFVQMRWDYQSGLLTSGSSPPKIILNMLVDYWSSEGILLPFLAIGTVVIFTALADFKKPVNERYLFIALCMLAYAPLLINGEYMTVYMLPLFALAAAFGLKGVISMMQSVIIALKLDQRLTYAFFITCIMSSILFSNIMLDHWISQVDTSSIQDPNWAHKQWMQEQTYQVSLFLENYKNKVIFSDGLNARRIGAMIGEDRQAYFPEEYMTGHSRDTERVRAHIISHDIEYVVENENIPKQYAGTERLYPSRFMESLYNQTDKIYDDGLNGVWDLGDPKAAA